MLRLIIGGVTLAAVGYAIKEYCEEEGCPWDKPSYTKNTTEEEMNNVSNDETIDSFKKSEDFYKFKKSIYEESMTQYEEFLQKHLLQNSEISTEIKLEEEKLSEELITHEVASYIAQISNTLDILVHNLSLETTLLENKQVIEANDATELNSYANNIYALSHLKLFDAYENLNKVEILSSLVQAMGLTIQKNTIPVNLESA